MPINEYLCEGNFCPMNMLKTWGTPLLLVIVYLVSDVCFGALVGSVVALALGLIEFIRLRIREKRTDKFLLWTTFLFCLPGVLEFCTEGSDWSILQPVVVEVVLGVLFGVFAFSRISPVDGLPVGLQKRFQFSAPQLNIVRKRFKVLFYIVIGHAFLVSLLLLLVPGKVADFIANTLIYILVVGYFLVLFLSSFLQMRKFKGEEWLPVVDAQGKVIGRAPRSVCHSGSKLLHPVVHLHIINKQGDIFLQKRSHSKKFLPGKWDTAVGGHISVHETVETALKREAWEELGISQLKVQFLASYIWESEREKELVFVFLCQYYDCIHIDNPEVEEGRFWNRQEICQKIDSGLFTPNLIHEYRLFFKLADEN